MITTALAHEWKSTFVYVRSDNLTGLLLCGGKMSIEESTVINAIIISSSRSEGSGEARTKALISQAVRIVNE